MAKSIGIDLGTTNSVGSIKKVHVEIIKNAEGEFITPSCVTVKKKKLEFLKPGNNGDFVVGRHALEWIKQDPENTITSIKRLMGRSLSNPEVQKIITNRRQQYQIKSHTKGSKNSLAVILNKKEYTPEQISAKILEKMKEDTQKALNDQVEYAVITVPAYFNDKQKHATRTAAALSGLKVRRLLPEPTAAAISFGVDAVNNDEAKTVLIFDFGGGTFDLSVLTISGGQFIEQGKGGNMWMGGEDIDSRIADFVLDETAREYGIENIKGFVDGQKKEIKNRFLGELKVAVERAKIRLSGEEEANIEILGVLKDEDDDRIDVDVELTRKRFESIILPIIESAMNLTRKLLQDIHFTPDLIDNVLLVGGSSRIPAVIEALEEEFGKHKVLLHDRPMLAIAEGAAILSHRLSDTYECPQCGKSVAQSDSRCTECDFDLEKHTIEEGLFDIVHSAAHDYYIYLENNEKHLLIEKNTPLPCEQTEVFKLVHKDQRLVHMRFFNVVNENEESIGDLWLGVDENKQNGEGPLSIEMIFKIDENNLVAAAASLKELPDAQVSQTLSRGKADEKLFLSLEEIIDGANKKGESKYVILDLTSRVLSIVKDIHKVIDKKTGEVAEPVYNLAEMKIDKAGKMMKQGITCKPLIYYANSVLSLFGRGIPSSAQASIRKGIKKLEEMDEHGTFEKNLAAYKKLDSELEKLPMINMLMILKKAGDICEDHEPAKAGKFFSAIEKLLAPAMDKDDKRTKEIMTRILPQAAEILKKYDKQSAILYKDITR